MFMWFKLNSLVDSEMKVYVTLVLKQGVNIKNGVS